MSDENMEVYARQMAAQEQYPSQQIEMAYKLERERLSEMRVKSEIEFLTDVLLGISSPYKADLGNNQDMTSQMHDRLDRVRIDATMRIAELARLK